MLHAILTIASLGSFSGEFHHAHRTQFHLLHSAQTIGYSLISERVFGSLDDIDRNQDIGVMSAEQLRTERQRLIDDRPGLGGGLGMTITGGALLLGGIALGFSTFFLTYMGAFYSGLGYLGAVFIVSFAIMTIALIAVGIPLLAVGIVKLVRAIRARRVTDERIELIEQRLESQPSAPPANLPVPQVRNDVPALIPLASF